MCYDVAHYHYSVYCNNFLLHTPDLTAKHTLPPATRLRRVYSWERAGCDASSFPSLCRSKTAKSRRRSSGQRYEKPFWPMDRRELVRYGTTQERASCLHPNYWLLRYPISLVIKQPLDVIAEEYLLGSTKSPVTENATPKPRG